MGDSSLREDGIDMLRMSNMMGTERDINMMGMDQQRYSNIMMGRNMMGQDSMGRNMMGQETMSRNLMGQNSMGRNMMRQGNTRQNMMGRNMMGQDRTSQMISHKMIGQQNMTPIVMYNNMMGRQGMLGMTNKQLSSNVMDSNNRLMGQRMMQQMEHIPETYTSIRMF